MGHEYYFPLNAHSLLPSLGQLYSTAETRQVSGLRFQLEGRVLRSFLLACLVYHQWTAKPQQWSFQLEKDSTDPVCARTFQPRNWCISCLPEPSLLQHCAVAGVVERGGLNSAMTFGEPGSREWVALPCFVFIGEGESWFWSWHSPCYRKGRKVTSQNSLETRAGEKSGVFWDIDRPVRFTAGWWTCVVEAAWPGHAPRLTFMAVS